MKKYHFYAIVYGMITTIDSAGRIVVPKALRQALDLRPDYAEAHYFLGNILRGRRKDAEAEAAYRTAIDLRPDLAEAHCNLGNALGRQRKLGEAEAASRKAIDLNPGLAEAYFNLGNALNAQGKSREAESASQIAHECVVRVYDFGVSQGTPYICMEFVEGGSLPRHLPPLLRRRRRSPSPHQATSWRESADRARAFGLPETLRSRAYPAARAASGR